MTGGIEDVEYDGVNKTASGGFLGLFGLIEWFLSLTKEERDMILTYYGQGMNCDPDDLINGHIYYTSSTGTLLLANLALTALHNKNHTFAEKLLQKAGELIITSSDSSYYEAIRDRITEESLYIPDQKEIDIYKDKILHLLSGMSGVLQCDVKKFFEKEKEHIIGHALSQLKYEDKIRRVKKGRSYELRLPE